MFFATGLARWSDVYVILSYSYGVKSGEQSTDLSYRHTHPLTAPRKRVRGVTTHRVINALNTPTNISIAKLHGGGAAYNGTGARRIRHHIRISCAGVGGARFIKRRLIIREAPPAVVLLL